MSSRGGYTPAKLCNVRPKDWDTEKPYPWCNRQKDHEGLHSWEAPPGSLPNFCDVRDPVEDYQCKRSAGHTGPHSWEPQSEHAKQSVLCFIEFGAPGEKDVCVLPKGHLGKHSFTGDIEEDNGYREQRKREAWDLEWGVIVCDVEDEPTSARCNLRAYHRGPHNWYEAIPRLTDPESVPQITPPPETNTSKSIRENFPTREQRIRIHALECAIKTYQGSATNVYIEKAKVFEQFIIAGDVNWEDFQK